MSEMTVEDILDETSVELQAELIRIRYQFLEWKKEKWLNEQEVMRDIHFLC